MCPLVCHRVSRHTDDDGCLSRIREFPYLHFNIKTRHRHRHRPTFRAHSLSLSELLPNMLIKEELGGSSPLRVLIFEHFLEIIIELTLIFFLLKIKITSIARYLFYICEKMWETLTFLALEPPKRLLLDFLWGKLNYRQQMSQLCSQGEECRGGAWGLSCVLAGPRAVKYTGKL